MKNKLKSFLLGVVRFVPLAVCAIFMLIYLFGGKSFSVEDILNYTPDSKVFAAFFIVAMYAFKSLTVVFPITLLNIAGGFLFTPFHAIIVNSVGVIAELTVPYWIGRVSGSNSAGRFLAKHPKLSEMMEKNANNSFFKAFFLRVIAILPGDAISMYLGATKLPFGVYLLGSFLGTFPSMVAATLVGTSITDPTSPMFWISIISTVSISLISVLIYWIWSKHRKEETKDGQNSHDKEEKSC